jgi:hypothetical protein
VGLDILAHRRVRGLQQPILWLFGILRDNKI